MLTEQQRDFLFPKAVNAALRAGAAILEVYRQGDESYDITIKTDRTPITVADRRSHDIIKKYLAKTHVPLMSEEGREMIYDERRGWDLFWMVDPLDGTKEFIKGNGEFTVNIALMVDNNPVLSVVYVPYIGKLYFADRTQGAYLRENTEPDAGADWDIPTIMEGAVKLPLRTAANNPVKIAVSRSHNSDETYRYIDIIRKKYPDAQIVEQGSSYKFCLLAEGAVDCYVRTSNTYEWDTAAGELILELTGGATHSLPDGEPFEYNKISLLNPYFICRSAHMPQLLP